MEKNTKKAKTNKKLYEEFRDTIYIITKNAKTKLIKPILHEGKSDGPLKN